VSLQLVLHARPTSSSIQEEEGTPENFRHGAGKGIDPNQFPQSDTEVM
jgi:hypothetical protein